MSAAQRILFIICAPSGAGKTSLVRALVKVLPDVSVSVSHTTRARRPGERDAQDYHFVTKPAFKAMIAGGDLLEHALVFDHYYGTSRSWVEETLATIDVLLEIDWQGARQIREAFPHSVSIQVFPPSLHALEERLRARGQDSTGAIRRRMNDAVEEMKHFHEFDYLVVNDDFERALTHLQSIVLAERARTPRELAANPELVAHLLGADGRPGSRPSTEAAREDISPPLPVHRGAPAAKPPRTRT